MKKLVKLCVFLFFCLNTFFVSAQIVRDNGYNDGDISYQNFYDQLQPYGNWIDYPGYGYVWQPNAGPYFKPYETNGRWVSTIDGWAWASDYEWGWAPFHYGRWFFDPAIGWAWVPGYEWAPAWVTWGQYGDDYAWAPLAPGITVSIGSTWRAPYNYWSFIPRSYIGYPNQSRYLIRNRFNAGAINNITIINNYNSYNNHEYYHRGPDYREVERYTHRSISPLAITGTQRPGAARIDDRRFEVYRPNIARNSEGNNRNPSPARVRSMNDARGDRDVRNNGGVINQNNGGDAGRYGDYRNRTFNNGNNDRISRPGNVNPNSQQPGVQPSMDQRNQGSDRYQQNNDRWNNRNRAQAPTNNTTSPQPPASSPGYSRPDQSQNQQRGRWGQQQQAPNNVAQPSPAPQAQPAYQNRNMQRGENVWQQRNNNDQNRMQQRPQQVPAAAQNSTPVRNSEASPRFQTPSTERRNHERN